MSPHTCYLSLRSAHCCKVTKPLTPESIHDFRLLLSGAAIVLKGRIAHCRLHEVEPERVRAALDALIDTYENKVGPRNGARIVARAWTDAAYKKRLLSSAPAAIAELGFRSTQGEHMIVLENTPKVHNLVVCTLCSCYPWPVLGLPPVWYKSAAYRSRAVIDPQGVLKEFGLALSGDVELRVWDSTAELRYLVLPERPKGTDHMSEEMLAGLVTRNSMIGVEKITLPRPKG